MEGWDTVLLQLETTGTRAGSTFIARVDLLPSNGMWLLSELEVGWGSLFLQAHPEAAEAVALALEAHLVPRDPAQLASSAPSAETALAPAAALSAVR